jgi:4-amino-4-deoxy-L-arabinose transferase-like glycosyltransferase
MGANPSNAADSPGFWSPGRISLVLGASAGLLVLVTLGDPGITIDEPLDVRPGRKYVTRLYAEGWHFFDRDVVTEVFRDNAEHPPLGRWLLGVASIAGEPLEAFLGGPDPFSVHSGRLAPALAFATLVGLVSHAAGARYGRAAGVGAGVALILMPRVFSHAHLGALDTFLCLFWVAALLAAVRGLSSRRPVSGMLLAGVVWGLAVLTKIHAWLLPPILLVYVLACHRSLRRLLALAVWAGSGLVVFFAGWPWLWYDTAERLRAYFGTGVERTSLLVQYFGHVYRDRDVPWHYPWFYFLVTVPVGFHVLGALGLVQGWRMRRTDAFPLLLVGSIATFLVLFSTGVAVYDGERLFLVTFPLWAIVIGLGFRTAWRRAGAGAGAERGVGAGASAGKRIALRVILIALMAGQGYGVLAFHPFGLSYYNVLVGGLPGAERLGLELTYWGDAVDGVLLDELASSAQRGQTAALVPTLHHIQATACLTPALNALQIRLLDQSGAAQSDWLVVYRRTAYWPNDLQARLESRRPVAIRSRQGVWLSAVWPRDKRPPGAQKAKADP